MADDTARGLGLFGALGTTFDLFHESLDHWFQTSWMACNKRRHGDQLHYRDGVPVGAESDDRDGQPTLTASQLGRRACTAHVAVYTAGQIAAATAVTRMLGYRLPPSAVLAGAAITAGTHWLLDRGPTLTRLASLTGKSEYLSRVTVVRQPDGGADQHGAGTAWNEMDRSAHRLLGWVATAVTVTLALTKGHRS